MIEVKELRQCILTKGLLLENKRISPSHPTVEVIDDMRDEYIATYDLATYLSQMLHPIGNRPVDDFIFYDYKMRQIKTSIKSGAEKQPVQRYIRINMANELPLKIYSIKKDKEKYL